MDNREKGVQLINLFIKEKSISNALELFQFLCEIKNPNNKEFLIKFVKDNPMFTTQIVTPTLEELLVVLEINKLTDKNGNILTVL